MLRNSFLIDMSKRQQTVENAKDLGALQLRGLLRCLQQNMVRVTQG